MRFCVAVVIALVGIATACDSGPKSARGFRLPDGDIDKGKLAFVEIGCNSCHDVKGVVVPAAPQQLEVTVDLGGRIHRFKTYGELVTSIINPSHEIGFRYPRDKIADGDVSRMKTFNDVMTVTQLIDIVAFLQSNYQLELSSRFEGP